MQIIPAILEKEMQEFWARAEIFEKIPGVEKVQVDFCDGKFVSTTSLSISEIDVLNPTLEWEAHLMVMEPVDFFDYQMTGFKTIILHLEAFGAEDSALQQRGILCLKSLEEIKRLGMKVGLAINPETPVDAVLAYNDLVDQFTILSIQPGAQGREFMPNSLERIKQLRSLLPSAIIEVDGGINQSNIKQVLEAGADFAVVGSALKAEDTGREFERLNALGTI